MSRTKQMRPNVRRQMPINPIIQPKEGRSTIFNDRDEIFSECGQNVEDAIPKEGSPTTLLMEQVPQGDPFKIILFDDNLTAPMSARNDLPPAFSQ